MADLLDESVWRRLERPAKYDVKTTLRVKRDRVKEDIVVAREYLNIVLQSEDVAEFDYKPTKCKQSYGFGRVVTEGMERAVAA